jgi:hypothetical protein
MPLTIKQAINDTRSTLPVHKSDYGTDAGCGDRQLLYGIRICVCRFFV